MYKKKCVNIKNITTRFNQSYTRLHLDNKINIK